MAIFSLGILSPLKTSYATTTHVHLMTRLDDREEDSFGPGNTFFRTFQDEAVTAFQEHGKVFDAGNYFTLAPKEEHFTDGRFNANNIYHKYDLTTLAVTVNYETEERKDQVHGLYVPLDLRELPYHPYFTYSFDTPQEAIRLRRFIAMASSPSYISPGGTSNQGPGILYGLDAGLDYFPYFSTNIESGEKHSREFHIFFAFNPDWFLPNERIFLPSTLSRVPSLYRDEDNVELMPMPVR